MQLKGLTPENAERVARHLAMVPLLIEGDPELAHRHAKAAAQRAGRLAVVHETLGLTAYKVGDFNLALRELQAHRRMSGSQDQLPVIVDTERGLGRPERALAVAAEVDRSKLPVGIRINLAVAVSGARLDMGNVEAALRELEIPELTPTRVFAQSPLLFRSYAECLRELGRVDDAARWENLADEAEIAVKNPVEETIELIEELELPAERQPRRSEE
jgi:hypothetical protein